MILRGVFLGRYEDDQYLYQQGASYYFPEAYEEFSGFIPKDERNDLIKAYNKYLNSDNLDVAYKAAYH
ncbi:Proline iminopeptidase [Mycoplasmopsis arginini]|nr:Proline iminopeptidase [Chlamydia abortus]SGA06803.1 Proline iminopeptidase [Mycoplasmopsis arginini]SGA10071.1 Proline iminopeptidase [Mycoplasmopsis arginini]SGA32124.1 Proline iminopeptidase [Chlamydia abortus]